MNIIGGMNDPNQARMQALADRKQQLKQEKQQVNQQIKGEQRKRARLMKTASKLTSGEMLQVLANRVQAKAKAKAKAKG
jgi:hypothetical protein